MEDYMSKMLRFAFVVVGAGIILSTFLISPKAHVEGQDISKVATDKMDEKIKNILSNEIAKLKGDNVDEIQSAKESITMVRSYIINELITVVRNNKVNENKRDNVIRAIELLGEFRAVESISTLVDMVDYERPNLPDTNISDDYIYPAIGALIQIGKPSLNAIGQLILTVDSPKKLMLVSWAILVIEGKVNGRTFVHELGKKATTEQAK